MYNLNVTVNPCCSNGLLLETIALINASLSETVAEPADDVPLLFPESVVPP